jgi:hypothetical protein
MSAESLMSKGVDPLPGETVSHFESGPAFEPAFRIIQSV